MKNIDKTELGKRLLRYFRKCGCEVQVLDWIENQNGGRDRSPTVYVYRISRFAEGEFQKREDILTFNGRWNDSYEKLMRGFVDEYCGDRSGFFARWGFSSNEFVTAQSPEELEMKLATRGF